MFPASRDYFDRASGCHYRHRVHASTIQKAVRFAQRRELLIANVLPFAIPMPIPNATEATAVTEKVRDYLLNPEHPDGGSKAVWFQSLGYARDR